MTLMTPAEYQRGEDMAQILDSADIDGPLAAEAVIRDAIAEADTEEDLPDPLDMEDKAAQYARDEIQQAMVPNDMLDLRDEVADEEAWGGQTGSSGHLRRRNRGRSQERYAVGNTPPPPPTGRGFSLVLRFSQRDPSP